MEKYLGVKIINAEPMTNEEFCCQGIDKGNPNETPGYKVVYQDGYVSWSPKAVFEEAYRRIDNLTFGLAIEALKKGYEVFRVGWNGKNMFLTAVEDSKLSIPVIYLTKIDLQQIDPVYDYLGVWNCTQADMLAEDWQIVKKFKEA